MKRPEDRPGSLAVLMPELSRSLPPQSVPALNPREQLALQLVARGYVSKQIASLLQTTPKAVDMLIERATKRLGAEHRTHAVAVALRYGLIS